MLLCHTACPQHCWWRASCVLYWCLLTGLWRGLPGQLWACTTTTTTLLSKSPSASTIWAATTSSWEHQGATNSVSHIAWIILEKQVLRTVSGGCRYMLGCCSVGKAALLGRNLRRA